MNCNKKLKNIAVLEINKMSGQFFHVSKYFLMFVYDSNYLLIATQSFYLISFFIYIYFEVNCFNELSKILSLKTYIDMYHSF